MAANHVLDFSQSQVPARTLILQLASVLSPGTDT